MLSWFNFSSDSAVGRRAPMGKNFRSRMLTRTGTVNSLFMGNRKVLSMWLGYAAFLALFGAVSVQGQSGPRISFKETPLNCSSKSNTTFRFDVLEENGFNPCLDQQCSIQCKLDQTAFQDCSSCEVAFQNLAEGKHVFSVSVQVPNESLASAEYSWTVDTIPPTAVLDGGDAFTNKGNVTINITFSEECENPGGFFCGNASSCEMLVYGAATVIPSTLEEIEKGRAYTLVVEISSDVSSGRVVVAVARSACSDAAGNLFQRTDNSTFVIHFDRTIPTVNMWTALPDFDIRIGSVHQTIQATNKISDLRIYLDFNEPITTTADELLALLNVSTGILSATHRNTAANRRFGYVLRNIEKVSVVTISLPGNAVASRYGTLVPKSSSTTFLYDTERPEVHLSTSYPAKFNNRILPIEVHFTEAVFGFNASGVTVSGGTLTSFKEISKSTYILDVYVVDNNLVSAIVPERQCMDVAGNVNLASPTLQVRHYTTPAVSVVLYYLTTAGLLSTAFVSGALTISSAILAAVGALSNRETGSIGIDPSRNLLGMACHLQIFALSDWLSVSLPIEYREVTSGLQWLIPHVKTPWQHDRPTNVKSEFERKVMTSIPKIIENSFRGRRRLLAMGNTCVAKSYHRGRMLGANTTIYGPAFERADYESFFQNPLSDMSVIKERNYSGWRDFQRNMFWIGVVAGALVLLHILILRFVRWRTNRPLQGALTIPRPELFILILAIPGLCQASAFIIRGGTTLGVAIGVFLLLIPVIFLLTMTIFVIHGICFRAVVQYKEFRSRVDESNDSSQLPRKQGKVVTILAGSGVPGIWVRRSRLALTFLPRYGLLFEDRKGPPKVIAIDAEHKYANGTRDKPDCTMDTDDDSDEMEVSCFHRTIGCARAAYILLDLSRRIILGVVFGAYPRSDQSWSQVSLVFGLSLTQFVYLVLVRPFRKRGVQLVETTSLLCEVGVFSVALALLVNGDPTKNHFAAGILMLVFLLTSFLAELVNEWYAIMKQLLNLSTSTQEPSLKEGLKMLAGGFIILFIPRGLWSRFVNFPPPSLTATVPALSSSNPIQESNSPLRGILERQRRDSAAHAGNQSGTPTAPESLYHPGSPAYIDPRSTPQSAMPRDEDSGPPSGELRPEGAQKAWNSTRTMEGKKSKGASKDSKTEDIKMLRELAKASFARRRRDDECGTEQGIGSGKGGMGTPVDVFSPAESPQRRDQKRYSRRRRQFPGISMEGCTDDSISEATSDAETLHDDPPSLPYTSTIVEPAALVGSSSRSHKPGSGHSEGLSPNLPFRERGIAIRPLEER